MKIKSYSRIRKKGETAGLADGKVPNLLSMQVGSFDAFLQKDIHPQKRLENGLQAVLSSIFPIEDHKGIYHLEYLDYLPP